MPLPLAIPFAIKGALVLAKFLASHHVSAATIKGAAVAIKTYGGAQGVTLGVTGLTIVGFGVWTVERIQMCQNAVDLVDSGKPLQAANEFVKLLKSFSVFNGDDLVEQLKDWVADGGDIASPAFGSIVSSAREILDEAARTSRTLNPA